MKTASLMYDWFTGEDDTCRLTVLEKKCGPEAPELSWDYVEEKGGAWITILNCPRKERHSITDSRGGVSGPTFAECAACPHQAGTDFQELNADGCYDGAAILPENLRCSFHPLQ